MQTRRNFIQRLAVAAGVTTVPFSGPIVAGKYAESGGDLQVVPGQQSGRDFNSPYTGQHLNRIAFPIGGIGAGMVCMEGTGAISHVSVRNTPDIHHEPFAFATLCIKGKDGNTARILEGPVPEWKYFGKPQSSLGLNGTSYGFPRFREVSFLNQFPFGEIGLEDKTVPVKVGINGWSPFIPGDEDSSSLPVGAFEYTFENGRDRSFDCVFSFHSENFMHIPVPHPWLRQVEEGDTIESFPNGFLLSQKGSEKNPHHRGQFAFFTDREEVKVNHHWFRGVQFDSETILWNTIQKGMMVENPPIKDKVPGASLFVPFRLEPGEKRVITLKFCWFVPETDLRKGADQSPDGATCSSASTHKPWYAAKFKDINQLSAYWSENYNRLREKTALFSSSFFGSTLPPEVLEAVAANLSILKSPTVLRQTDGRLWAWEGCRDNSGCCSGSCTHVWNYAQAIPHLFPSLERTLRETEFLENQSEDGFQKFRASLPIRPTDNGRHPAADGQLGGILKMYREWRISGDYDWLRRLWPEVKTSMDFCIAQWDPRHRGIIEEPHHNTYDIEFWGPNGMCTSFYLGALTAFMEMCKAVGEPATFYRDLFLKGKRYTETELYNGEYFVQKVSWKGLNAKDPTAVEGAWNIDYSPEALLLFRKEGPKYQYGNGCLSDGVLGAWLARVCGISDPILDGPKVRSHLKSVHYHNLKSTLVDHVNPQRPSYALGNEGGLLLCTWPYGEEPTLPFVYSDEVWTGIEYQLASHLIMEGMVEEGLEIVRTCRKRYDGRIRNPFNEYECGSWYARAMSSYSLLQALTGLRYDAVEKALYFDSRIGDDFTCFLSTETGFGMAGLKGGLPFLEISNGEIHIGQCWVSGEMAEIKITKV